MFALKFRRSGHRPHGDDAQVASGERMVLPRPLRRVARIFAGLAAGRILIPNHVGSVALVGFFALTGSYAVIVNGESGDVAQAVSAAAGFAINNVKVSGNLETSEIDILERLGLDGTTSLVALDVEATRLALKKLPWILDAEVRKVYPDTIEIRLTERKAFGIWQHGTDLSLIEKDGSVIVALRDNKFARLPLFVGRGAETGAATIMADFDAWPDVKQHVKAFIRVAGRRWDIRLDSGITIKLPEQGMDEAMSELAELNAQYQLIDRDVAAVDLRLNDRVTVQLTPDAVERRNKALEARAKALKKAGEQI